ncbi:hypothetical protein HDU87_006193 [Geranomyces variabilis]|uniref:AAA+ ATPase domain-containing protein n=1 Tax=Geranomyces variabilis TaxID=109894 RepID=A0AAD5XQT1_9FUNG|nr:hypothetical protein HDU87_006193 [Geranomyces variabilis]
MFVLSQRSSSALAARPAVASAAAAAASRRHSTAAHSLSIPSTLAHPGSAALSSLTIASTASRGKRWWSPVNSSSRVRNTCQARSMAQWTRLDPQSNNRSSSPPQPPQQPQPPPPSSRVRPDPPQYPQLHTLERNYQTAQKITETLDPAVFPYRLDAANKQTLKALTLAALAGRKGFGKNIVLASPHPGASIFMERTMRGVAKEANADILALDYVDVLAVVAELRDHAATAADGKAKASAVVDSSEQQKQNMVLMISPSFSPASYYVERDEDDMEHEEDYEDNEEEDDVGSKWAQWARERLPQFAMRHQQQQQQPQPVVLNLNVSTASKVDNAKFSSSLADKLRTEGAAASPQPLKVSLGSGSAHNPATVPAALAQPYKGSPYDQPISEPHLRDFSHALLSFIVARCASMPHLANLQSPRRLVLYLRDATDVVENAALSGRELMLCFMAVVEQLQNVHRIPVVLVAGCSPSLLVPGNVSRGRDPEFFGELFEGRADTNTVDPSHQARIWADGRLFATPLDAMDRVFDKIELLPPTPYLVSPTNPYGGGAYEAQASWLELMQEDMARRISDINLKRIEAYCARKRTTVHGLKRLGELFEAAMAKEGAAGAAESAENAAAQSAGVGKLEEEVWTLPLVERLVAIAVGIKLERAPADADPLQLAASLLNLDAEHLAEALVILSRSSRAGPIPEFWPDSEPSSTVAPAIALADSNGATPSSSVFAPAPTSSAAGASSATGGAASATAEAETIQQQLKRENVKLNQYETKLLSTVINPSAIPQTLDDLVLPASTKLLLQTLTVLPVLRPSYFATGVLSRHSVSGVLLFGPPGTGKTLLAKAIAKHSSARFMSVALSDVYDKFVGEGEKNVKAVFTLARKCRPCVVFLDEVDALFGRRGGMDQGNRREVVNEFMSEWDGLSGDNRGVVVLGATNRPFDLDDAILRRMPRRILVDLPNREQREEILRLHLAGEVLDNDLDLAAWATRTEKFSGSDLKNLCIAAALARIREAVGGDTGLAALVSASSSTSSSLASQAAASAAAKRGAAALVSPAQSLAETSAETSASTSSEPLAATAASTSTPTVTPPPTTTGRRTDSKRRSTATSSATSLPTSAAQQQQYPALPPLAASHFEVAATQIAPSLTDEMQTLVELRKWDALYGEKRDGSAAGAKKLGWGFAH